MEDVIGTVTIPNKFAHRESYEQTIKVYLKYIFNTLLEKTLLEKIILICQLD